MSLKIICLTNYISIKEASEKYNYSQRQIRRWCNKGKITAFKSNRYWFIDEPLFEDFLADL